MDFHPFIFSRSIFFLDTLKEAFENISISQNICFTKLVYLLTGTLPAVATFNKTIASKLPNYLIPVFVACFKNETSVFSKNVSSGETYSFQFPGDSEGECRYTWGNASAKLPLLGKDKNTVTEIDSTYLIQKPQNLYSQWIGMIFFGAFKNCVDILNLNFLQVIYQNLH